MVGRRGWTKQKWKFCTMLLRAINTTRRPYFANKKFSIHFPFCWYLLKMQASWFPTCVGMYNNSFSCATKSQVQLSTYQISDKVKNIVTYFNTNNIGTTSTDVTRQSSDFHFTSALKVHPKFQVPTFNFWRFQAAKDTDRQTDRQTNGHLLSLHKWYSTAG